MSVLKYQVKSFLVRVPFGGYKQITASAAKIMLQREILSKSGFPLEALFVRFDYVVRHRSHCLRNFSENLFTLLSTQRLFKCDLHLKKFPKFGKPAKHQTSLLAWVGLTDFPNFRF